MLKAEINRKEGIIKVEANGCLPELMADVTNLLSVVYECIREEQKEDFKNCVKDLADKELYAKNEEEIAKLAKEQENKVKEKLKKELEDLLKDMPKDLLKMFKDILK